VRNYLLLLRYDGTGFHGWQRQDDAGASVRTVQGELERALATILGPEMHLKSSSRTDAGVHALAHPVNVQADSTIPPEGLLKGLNSLLPPDLSVFQAFTVPREFNAKKLALGKTYRYQWVEGVNRDPFVDRYAWRVKRPLDVPAMRTAASHLVGEHDFDAFRAAHCDAASSRRLLTGIVLERTDRLLSMTITGNAFLRNMVRIIAGSLTEVGLGRRTPEWIKEVLDSKDRTRAGQTAPPHGLFLLAVAYPPELLSDNAHGF
jgi:tRNA pseudouridine38-40 synthase